MATRRSTQKASRKKTPPRKKGTGRKAARTQASRKKTPRKKASRKKPPARKKAAARKKLPARKKAARKTPTPKKVARKRSATPRPSVTETLARNIIRGTTGDPAQISLADLYAANATSTEASGDTVTGFSGLEQKARQWEAMQEHTVWKPLHVFVNPDSICIEWDAVVKLRDGRVVKLRETAVHEVKAGRIVAERYYYNPMALAPPESPPA
jgi:ketosteroid isomerase-like protein